MEENAVVLGVPGKSAEVQLPSDGGHLKSRVLPMAVDIKGAAQALSVSDDTVRREIDRGKLRAVRIGRVWRVRVAELEAYLKRCEEQVVR
jgi:excisionase family DNA binding protein